MKDLRKIPKDYTYRTSWGHASYTHMYACVDIYDDKNDQNVVLEIRDKNETFRIVQLSVDEYTDLARTYPVFENGMPLLYHFGYYKEDEEYDMMNWRFE